MWRTQKGFILANCDNGDAGSNCLYEINEIDVTPNDDINTNRNILLAKFQAIRMRGRFLHYKSQAAQLIGYSPIIFLSPKYKPTG